MKIVIINAVYEVGSTGRNVKELSDYFNSHGHETYVVATRLKKEYDKVYQIGNRTEWNLHQGLSRLTGLQGYFSVISTRKMLRWLDEIKPDIVHLNNLRAGAFNFPLLFDYLSKRKIPVSITLHDCFMYTGRCWYYTVKGCFQWKDHCVKCPSTEKCEKSWFFDNSYRLFEDKKKWFGNLEKLAVIGVSEWITNQAKQSFLKEADIITTIYNWVDLDVFCPANQMDVIAARQSIGIDNQFVILCIASGLNKEKGLDEIIFVASNMVDVKIVMVGHVNEKIELPDNCIKLGTIYDTKELATLYSMADVMVTPSPEETFGKTTAEALACGTPVIGYNMTATAELLSNGTGILVDYSTGREGILEAVKKMRKTSKKQYQERCRSFAEEHFDMNKNILLHLSVFSQLLEKDS